MRFCACLLLVLSSIPLPEAVPADAPFKSHIAPFLKKYCTGCHAGEKPKADLDLGRYREHPSVPKERETWERVAQMLTSHEMPPEEKRQPPEEDRVFVIEWIRGELNRFDCSGGVDPGRITVRRLNRADYNNTIRDLLGVDTNPADALPADEVGYGFDNIGDVLSLSPLHLEKYLQAADEVVELASGRGDPGEDQPSAYRAVFSTFPTEEGTYRESAREILRSFASRAFRRPAREDEVERLVALVSQVIEEGGSFQEGIKDGLKAVLVSPQFLFRLEADPEPRNPEVHPVGGYQLASRLSYFLWSTMPDEELLELAARGELGRDEVLPAQVRRMLRDPRVEALVQNFAEQWLQIRLLDSVAPDPELFPRFDGELREAMRQETLAFFRTVLREDRSILEFIDSDYSLLNERMARHYGIDGIEGKEFRRVPVDLGARGGLLTQASILTITSNPTRTSPVKRGKWILEQIVGDPPPPPPPDVPELEEDQEAILSGSLRERMVQHRSDPNCAVCHNRMDAIGFAFENFDAVGNFREFDGRFLIDPSGLLPDGRSFEGPEGLKKILLAGKDDFARALAEKMLTYALGRGLEYYDRCALDQVVENLAVNEYRFSSLILGVVNTDAFRMRRGNGTKL